MRHRFFGNEEALRKQQLELVSMLNRWYRVKEDLLFAFEKCGESNIGEPTKSLVKDFIVRIRGGLGIERALELFSESYSDKQFKSFATQVRFNLKYRGNTGELLDNLETQYSRIDEEWTRRKIQSSKDRYYLYGIFAVTPVIAALVLVLNPSAQELFLHKAIGGIFAILAFLSYGIGFLLYYMASRYKI